MFADEQPESSIVNSVVAAVMVLIIRALVDMPGGTLRL
ncbi:putative membrane protein [Synechococcus sp. MVIR-18-1]|nr:putative membrane protein [Synechococcus sp. MVIR-18-1]